MPQHGLIDLEQTGRPGLIGVWRAGDVLIDSGPASCVDTLFRKLGDWRPSALLLTHIHLDHAGAAGALVERWPGLLVFVHHRGAPHLIDPERLMRSAARVFDDVEGLFGVMTPTPAQNVRELGGGEVVYGLEVDETLGHASHHLSFFDPKIMRSYPGDAAGVALREGPVVPPTPPPDIDLERWRESVGLIERKSPSTLALPHFGLISDVTNHLAEVRSAIDEHERAAAAGHDSYVEWLRTSVWSRLPPEHAADYEVLVSPTQNFMGLDRAGHAGSSAA